MTMHVTGDINRIIQDMNDLLKRMDAETQHCYETIERNKEKAKCLTAARRELKKYPQLAEVGFFGKEVTNAPDDVGYENRE